MVKSKFFVSGDFNFLIYCAILFINNIEKNKIQKLILPKKPARMSLKLNVPT